MLVKTQVGMFRSTQARQTMPDPYQAKRNKCNTKNTCAERFLSTEVHRTGLCWCVAKSSQRGDSAVKAKGQGQRRLGSPRGNRAGLLLDPTTFQPRRNVSRQCGPISHRTYLQPPTSRACVTPGPSRDSPERTRNIKIVSQACGEY